MSSDEENIDIEHSLSEIGSLIVFDVMAFLKTGIFKNKSNDKYVKAYTIVYRVSQIENNDNDFGSSLYKYYSDKIVQYCEFARNKLSAINPESEFSQNINFFETLLSEFEKCKILIHWLQKIFSSLDKFYIPDNRLKPLFDQGLLLVNKNLFTPIKKQIFTNICTLINYHRDGMNVNLNLIMKVVDLFIKFELESIKVIKNEEFYDIQGTSGKKFIIMDWFDNYFKNSTNEYFSKKSEELISRCSPSEYFIESLKFYDEESTRIKFFLESSFTSKIFDMFNGNFIDNNSLALTEVSF